MSTKCAFLFKNSIFFFENSVDPDQLASDEASWSRSTHYESVIPYE